MSDDKPSWFERLESFLSREPQTQTQLIEVLRDAEHHHLIDRDALKMIEGVIAVSDKKVRDIMIPRPQMTVIQGDFFPLDILPTLIHSQHSRFPVIGDSPDKIIGILLAKDILPLIQNADKRPIRDLARPAIFVPETKPLDVLLKEFRVNRHHMAIVVDEYGGVAGLVTIEDVLEEIVGDIEDEYDVDEKSTYITALENNVFVVNALTSIHDFNAYFQTQLSDADFDTIGGFIVQKFGYLPKRNETIAIDGFDITIIKTTRRRIQMMQFMRRNET